MQFTGVLPGGRGLQIYPNSALKDAWTSTLDVAYSYGTRLTDNDSSNDTIVDVATGHAGVIAEVALILGMAYLVDDTNKTMYENALFKYADQLLNADRWAGSEFSGSGRIEAMGIIYDWLYSESQSRNRPSTGFTYKYELANAIRETLRASLVTGIESVQTMICGANNTFVDNGWSCKPGFSPAYLIGGHSIGDHAEVLAGVLAIVGEAEDTDNMSNLLATLYDHYFDVDSTSGGIYNGIYASRDWINVDGGSQMGWSYSAGHTDLDSVKLWQVGTDVAIADTWQSKQFFRYVYGLRGDNYFPPSGDDTGLSYTNSVYVPFLLWTSARGSAAEAPYAQRFYNTVFRPNVDTANRSRMYELLFWQGNYPEAPLTQLPYSRLFANAGQVLMRDSWDYASATLLEFKSTSFWSENHHHSDQNAFTVFYKAPLLIDSGFYDGYNTTHWYNYYTRTIAHNTVTVWDPAEEFIKYGNKYSNDGGQRFIFPFYPSLSDIKNVNGSNHLDGVVTYEYQPDFTYTVGNASKAYTSTKLDPATGFLRNVVFLRNPASFWTHPVTVVFDKVTAVKDGLPKRFLLHTTVNAPVTLEGVTSSVGIHDMPANTNTMIIRNRGGMLFSQTLLPENPIITVIGGRDTQTDYRFMAPRCTTCSFGGDYTLTPFTPNPNEVYPNDPNAAAALQQQIDANSDVGAWRIEVKAPAPGVGQTIPKREYFLHVLSVADNSPDTSHPIAQNLSSASAAVTLIKNTMLQNIQTIVFSKGDQPASALSWNTPAPDTNIIVTGLKPKTSFNGNVVHNPSQTPAYTVNLMSTSGSLVSSAQGVLVIDTPLQRLYTLTAAKTGSGTCTIASVPTGISCGADCTEPYTANSSVTLTATLASDSLFGGWTGCNSTSGNSCTVTMDNSKTVTANCNKISADLSLTNTDAPDPVLVNDNIVYTLKVSNAGPQAATTVTLTDPLPSGTSFVSIATTKGSCSGTTIRICSLGTLNSGATATVTLTVKATTAGNKSNTATVSATESDPNTANNSATATTAVLASCVTTGKNISGTVKRITGTGITGVSMLLIRTSTTPQCGNRVTTSGTTGSYSFTKLPNATYSVTPSKTGCTGFTQASASVVVSGANMTQNFTGACP